MGKKNLSIIFLLLGGLLFLPGCISFKTQNNSGKDGGVHFSQNKGRKWQKNNLIPVAGGNPKTIAGIAVKDLVPDPSDPNALYMASKGAGMYYTFNFAEGWNKAKGLPNSKINSVAVDPQSKCIIYASTGNKLFQSTDCNRSWETVYYDNDPQVGITSIAIDHYDSSQVYIGTSRGDLLKSEDRGDTWSPVKRWNNNITGIYISPHDSRVMFVTTKNKGTFRTRDRGENWTSLEEKMKDFNNSKKVRDLDLHESQEGLMFLTTNYGLLKSTDYGDNWSQIELLTPEKKATINAVAVNPKNPDEIYYVTETTFYRSLDGGDSWSSRALPTSRKGADLLINSEKPNIIYLGAGVKPNQGGGGGPF